MKRILILIHVLFCGYICPLLAEDTGAARYQDSILKVADALPATLVRLTYLRDMAYKHQYAPYNMTFPPVCTRRRGGRRTLSMRIWALTIWRHVMTRNTTRTVCRIGWMC